MSRGFCNATGPIAFGSVNTTWKYSTGRRSAAWHFGQLRFRHELYATRWCPHPSHASTCPPSAAVRHRAIARIACLWAAARVPILRVEPRPERPDHVRDLEDWAGHDAPPPSAGTSGPLVGASSSVSNGLLVALTFSGDTYVYRAVVRKFW